MTAADQKRFLAHVRKALGVGSPRPAPAGLFMTEPSEASIRLLERIRNRDAEGVQQIIARLRKAASSLNADLHVAADLSSAAAIVSRLTADRAPEWGSKKQVAAWRHPLISGLNLQTALEVPVFYSEPDPSLPGEPGRRRLLERIAGSFIGVTAADFCVADTATLVLCTRPGQARSVSLLPSIHVAVVEAGRLVADLSELYALLRWDPARDRGPERMFSAMTLISGPSKTADIEATLVHGAHGPRELHLIVVDTGKILDSGPQI